MVEIKTICIVGLGYVGLPTAVAFAKKGYKVHGADVNEKTVQKLNSGVSTIPEILPNNVIKEHVDSGNLSVTTDTPKAVKESDAILITVPTPVNDSKNPELRFVRSAAESVAKGLGKNKLVVLESTVYPGATEEIVQPILEKTGLKAGKDFGLAYCPERYNPGDKKHTLSKMARVVGAINDEWLKTASHMYAKITDVGVHEVSNIKTAEAAKVIENTQRDINIALVNELALIFDRIGIDTREVLDAAATKWNFHHYTPGPGCGGHCIPVDPYYLVFKAKELGYEAKIITAGRKINDYMAHHTVVLAARALNERKKPLSSSKIAVLGIAYKGNIADARESPARHIIEELLDMKADVYAYDPLVPKEEIESFSAKPATLQNALKDADCIIIHTDHEEFKNLDLSKASELVRTKTIVDTRGVIDPREARKHGFLLARI